MSVNVSETKLKQWRQETVSEREVKVERADRNGARVKESGGD